MPRLNDKADLNKRFRSAKLHGVTVETTRHGKVVIYTGGRWATRKSGSGQRR